MKHPRLAIVIGSTRPGRSSDAVARWVFEAANGRQDAEFEIVDIAEYDLPLYDEPFSPSKRRYTQPHTIRWSETIARFDGYIFVTPEYNHGIPGALKNAIDFLYHEWAHKVAAFVSYGGRAGGSRAIEQLRLNLASLMVLGGRVQVLLSTHNDFDNGSFHPSASRPQELAALLDEVVELARRSIAGQARPAA